MAVLLQYGAEELNFHMRSSCNRQGVFDHLQALPCTVALGSTVALSLPLATVGGEIGLYVCTRKALVVM